jgi:hypothetical protein
MYSKRLPAADNRIDAAADLMSRGRDGRFVARVRVKTAGATKA